MPTTPSKPSALQQLLRGRTLYVLLILIAASLYARLMVARPLPGIVEPPKAADPAPPITAESLDWWPQELDPEAINRLAAEQPLLIVSLWLLTMLVVGLSIGGILLTVRGVLSGRFRKLLYFTGRFLPRWSFGELGRILMLAILFAAILPFIQFSLPVERLHDEGEKHFWIVTSMMCLDLFVIMVVLAFSAGKGRSLARTWGVMPERLPRSLGTGLLSYVTVFPWLFIVLAAVVEAMRRLGLKPPMEPLQQLILHERDPWILGLTLLLACVIGPIAEELLFRGVLYPILRRRMSRLAAILLSAAAFALVHTNWVGFLSIMLLGCLLANLYERTGSIASPVFIHMIHNIFLLSVALVIRQLQLSV
jgi:membrane protease YdiL (CAAX protease family)